MVFAALQDIASVTGLSFAADIKNHVVPRLIHAGLYELGSTLQLAHEAIGEAISAGAQEMTIQHFARAYRARSGCADSVNPFIVPRWETLDCTLVLRKTQAEAEAASHAVDLRNARKLR